MQLEKNFFTSSVFKQKLSALIVLVLCSGILFMWMLSLIDIMLGWDHDAGQFLTHSLMIHSGFKPYIDFTLAYTPFLIWLHSLVFYLKIDPIVVTFGIPFFWILANTVATFWLGQIYTKNIHVSLLVSFLYPFFAIDNGGHHVTLEHGVVFFSIISLISLKFFEKLEWKAFFSSFFLSLAILSKQIAAITAIPILIFFLYNFRKKLILFFLLGLFTPIVITLFWLRFDWQSIYQNFFVNFANYATQEPFKWDPIFLELTRSPYSTALIITAITFSSIAVWIEQSKKYWIWVTAALTTLALYWAPRFIRDYPHYTLNCWPFLVLLLISPHFKKLKITKQLIVGAVPILVFSFCFIKVYPIVKPFYFKRWALAGHGLALGSLYPAGQFIAQSTTPGSKIRVIGGEPILQVFSNRLPEKLSVRNFKIIKENDLRDEIQDPYWNSKHTGNLTVLTDYGQIWMEKKRESLIHNGYKRTYCDHRYPYVKVEIYQTLQESIVQQPVLLNCSVLSSKTNPRVN